MVNSNDAAIMRCMSDNIKGKFSLLASQLPGMSVKSFNGIQYVDCGKQSDTFNTVFGMPSGTDDINTITSYYLKKKMPAAWWLPGSSDEFRENFQQSGWVYEENEVGMQLDFGGQLAVSQPVFSRIEFGDSAERFQDFGRVLAAIFEPDNPTEAENVRAIYEVAGEYREEIPDSLVQIVAYLNDEPVSTATVYLTADVAGIFDIATPKAWRNRGFGSEIFRQAVRVAQQRGAKTCVLQASPDGLNIYKRHGFVPSGNFEVWNLHHES